MTPAGPAASGPITVPTPSGAVSIVGGGPGDPGLMTVRGRELLQQADVVVVDRLAPRALLAELAPHVEVIEAGKVPGGHSVSQDQINRHLVEHALAGRAVVRLKGGDPYVFGRGMEEVQACEAAGLTVEVVPGVSSAIAVPALAGIPVTHRGGSQGFTVVSGHVPPDDPASTLDWDALARTGTTLVLLMAVANLPAIARTLIAAGMDPAIPGACVSNGSTPEQRTVRAPLSGLARAAERNGVSNPAVIVIGPTAGDLTAPVPASQGRRRVLVLGGARSGKSAFAESMLSAHLHVEYVATAAPRPDDPEWAQRVAGHQARRPGAWSTREAEIGSGEHVLDLSAVCADAHGSAALVDSITAWLTSVLDRHGAWTDSTASEAAHRRAAIDADLEHLIAAWENSQRHIVAVTDEVGGGIVPASASGRLFRDELGMLNQRLAATADEVWQVTAGIPRRLR